MRAERRMESEVGDLAKKQCPACYRMCSAQDTVCRACGAALKDDASVLAYSKHGHGEVGPVDMPFFAFLAGTFRAPWRLFAQLGMRPMSPKLAVSFVIFYILSLVPLALAGMVRITDDGASIEYDKWLSALALINLVQLLVITIILAGLSRKLSQSIAFLPLFTLLAYVMGITNVIHVVQVPLALVPEAGVALVKSFGVVYVIWVFSLFFLLIWKALGVHGVPAFGLALLILMVHYGLFKLFQAVGLVLNHVNVLWELRW